MKTRVTIILGALSALILVQPVASAYAAPVDVTSPGQGRMNLSTQKTGTATISTITHQESPAERAISDKIRRAIDKERAISNIARRVEVTTQDGIVTLAGQVNSEAEKTRLQTIAQNIEGVSSVKNDLFVKTPVPRY